MRAVSFPAPVTSPADDDAEDPSGLVGRVLADRYRVTGLLGVGGIGRVYRAVHLVLKREVALKVLLEHYQCVPELQRRFEREAMALAALSHPNIVTITDFVSTRDATFLVMELVEGRDLDELLEAEGAVPPVAAFAIMEQTLSCLAYAHARDVIHRDLKPQNVLVRELPGDRVHATVLDFGLAKFMDGSGPAANLTKTGLVVGTPAYMAPEQASGGRADQRADVYAAGIMFFEMLAGTHPFEGFEGADLLRQHLLTRAPTLASVCPGARIAPELESFVARALEKDGADRFADGGAMLDAFLALPADAFSPAGGVTGKRAIRSDAPTAIGLKPTAPAMPAALSARGEPRRGGGLAWIMAAIMAAIAIGAITWIYLRGPSAPTPTPPPTGAVGPSPATETTAATAPTNDALTDDAPEAGDGDPTGAVEGDDEEDLEDEAEGEDTPLAVADDAPEDEPEEEIAPPAERPAARNPWREGTPRALVPIRRRVARGHPITTRHIRAVQQYRRRNPSDLRGRLALAQVYVARGWLTNALRQYRGAYRRDPSVRGDPRMRRDLARMTGLAPLHGEATDTLVEIYGEEARATLGRLLRREPDAETQRRYRAALDRLPAPD